MKYPKVYVSVPIGVNAFRAVNNVRRALRVAGIPDEEVSAFTVEACSGDYAKCIHTINEWVTTDMVETAA